MKTLRAVLAYLIRQGKVTVEIPNFDMDKFREAVRSEAGQMLEEVEGIVWAEEMTDHEKMEWIQNRLEKG